MHDTYQTQHIHVKEKTRNKGHSKITNNENKEQTNNRQQQTTQLATYKTRKLKERTNNYDKHMLHYGHTRKANN